MLADLFKYVRELSTQADGVQIATHDSMPEKVVVRQGDTHEILDVPPDRRRHRLVGYEDIVHAATDVKMVEDPEVYHDHGHVVVLLERADRRDSVTCELIESDRWQSLRELARGKAFDVRSAVRFLRFELHGTGIESVIRALSKVDFTRRSDGGTHVEHGRESLGRSVEAAVQGAEQIPEHFDVQVSVYANPGMKDLSATTVRCGIFLDVDGERIEIRVLADELQRAENQAQAALGAKLAEDLGDVAVFHGRP